MAVKKTIAIIVSGEEKAIAVVKQLALENYDILLLSKIESKFFSLKNLVSLMYPGASLDVMNCMKDGCWEADVIVLHIPLTEEPEVAALIKDVATQKIVICFSESAELAADGSLQKLLKYSKVVKVYSQPGGEVAVVANDNEAIDFVNGLLKNKAVKNIFG